MNVEDNQTLLEQMSSFFVCDYFNGAHLKLKSKLPAPFQSRIKHLLRNQHGTDLYTVTVRDRAMSYLELGSDPTAIPLF